MSEETPPKPTKRRKRRWLLRLFGAFVVLGLIGAIAAAGLYSAMGAAPRGGERAREAADGTAPGGAGALMAIAPDGESEIFCPLEHTDVRAEISGFLARVRVTQRFKNTSAESIEALYTFPLPADELPYLHPVTVVNK